MTGLAKKEWMTPRAVRYGSVRELTLQLKEKTFGAGDDVMVNNQAILADAS